jgi:hypothetical protein
MIRVFFWLPGRGNVGHASLEIVDDSDGRRTYISWWPKTPLNIYKKAAGTGQSLEDDEQCEGRPADILIEFESLCEKGLNEPAIREWWIDFQKKKHDYGFGGKNCSWVVIEALKAGGSDKYFPWYRITTQRNIPIQSVILPLIAILLRLSLLHGDIAMSARVFFNLQKYAIKFAKGIRPTGSLKLAAVAIADEFSNVWSPRDALAYSLLLQQNIDRVQSGKILLGAQIKQRKLMR